MTRVDVAVRANAMVGEGPFVDQATGRLSWVDLATGELFENDVATGWHASHNLNTLLGAAIPRRNAEGFAVAVQEGFGLYTAGRLDIVDPVLTSPSYRMNDAKCDSTGRMWAGSTEMSFAESKGALHRWDGSRSEVVAEGFSLPNGLGWDAAGTTMYLVDSTRGQLLNARFDADSGAVGEFHGLALVEDGLPDGLAVDVDGFIWIAVWGGSCVKRFDALGRLADVVQLPISQPSSCAFGADGVLYVTSARTGLTAEQLVAEPLAGSVLAVHTSTSGVPVASFNG